MAKIEDLVKRISDEKLRDEIAAEVRELKKHKQFGLVFEEHLPEMLRLPKVAIRVGNLVVQRDAPGNELWRVIGINGKKATCRQPINPGKYDEEKTAEFQLVELVLVVSFGEPIYPVLTPVDRIARGGPDKPWHILINADNYHALQLLLYAYERKVDVIYIDPPYNTGARDWKYNNDYVDKTDSFRHSKWLSMMKKRLLLAKRLLKDSGVLIVAIDDNENHHLRCLLDSIFPPALHMGTVCVRHKPGGTTTARKIARSHEYAFFYAASETVAPCMVTRTEEQISRFKHKDEGGLFEWENFRKHGQGCRKDDRPRQHYPIWLLKSRKMSVPKMDYDDRNKLWIIAEELPLGAIEMWPNRGKEKRVWLWAPENFTDNPSLFKYEYVRGEHSIYKKRRPNRVGVVPNTVWNDTKYSAAEHGSGMLVKIFGSTEPFDFAKSVYTVADCLSVATDNKSALIVDFFSGSGTTFHSTALLNSEDEGSRRCILVANNELKESIAKDANRLGLFPGDADYESKGIAESVTWPRCKYVIEGKRDDGTKLPGEHLNGRALEEGFEENLEYFRLDFVDPAQVERGDAFEGVLPILWMMAGAIGERESRRGSSPWYLAKHSPFAVLIQETKFNDFEEKLRERTEITHVFLVTDSEDNFALMRRELGRKYHCVQLYKSYLDNFRINTVDRYAAGKESR